MKKYFFVFAAFQFFGNAFAQLNIFKDAQQHFLANVQNSNYQFTLDLTKVHDDMLTVNLVTPVIADDTALYRMPAIVPGTYKVYNFGKFVHNFKAYDKSGKEIATIIFDKNSWKIPNAKNLNRLSYEGEDTWDAKQEGETVFEPAGTNFQADTNFVLNNHAIFGYFEGMKKNNYLIHITHPDGFFGATGLANVTREKNIDHYSVPDY